MKILTLSYEFPPIGGGGSRVVHGLARELVDGGHEVDLVTMGFGDSPREEVVDGVRVYRVPCFRRSESVCQPHEMLIYLLRAAPVVYRLATRNRYDINQTHFILPDGILAALLRRWTGLRFVLTTHGSDVPGYNPDRFATLHRVLAGVWRHVTHSAELVICPSHTIQELVEKQSRQISVVQIPTGIRPLKFDSTRGKLDRILVVTRMFPRKGVQYVLEALRTLPPGWELHVVGDGPYLPELKTLALELEANVVFHGWLDNGSPQLRELYETARIFAFTSEAENFPNVLLEGMAAGCAVVTTAGTGCAEVIGDTGVLVEPRNATAIRDAVHALIADPERCRVLGNAARERLENRFTWEAVASRYVEIYSRYVHPQAAAELSSQALPV